MINWRRLSPEISLSGQPTEQQLIAIRDLGVSHVVNLAPHTNTGSLKDEAASVAALGMDYIHIPVDFENPTEDDFTQFCDALKATRGEIIHIHCIYNARVSAFVHRHAKSLPEFDQNQTFALMDSIWRPGGVWAAFIGSSDTDEVNRYEGADY